MQCREAKLIETSEGKTCASSTSEIITVKLEEANLNDSYFSGASIIINGDNNTKAAVHLPKTK